MTIGGLVLLNTVAIVANTIIIFFNNRIITKVMNDDASIR